MFALASQSLSPESTVSMLLWMLLFIYGLCMLSVCYAQVLDEQNCVCSSEISHRTTFSLEMEGTCSSHFSPHTFAASVSLIYSLKSL